MRNAHTRFGAMRIVLVGLLLGAILSVGTTGVWGQTSAPIKFEYLNQQGVTTQFHIFLAKDKGFFAQEGIDIAVIDTGAPTGSQVQAVASGSVPAPIQKLSSSEPMKIDGRLRGPAVSIAAAAIPAGGKMAEA